MNTTYWEEEIETMSRKKLQELQLERLKKTINIAANAPYYKKVFQEHGITIPFLGIDYEKIQDSIREIFQKKGDTIVELNLKALAAGKEIAEKTMK